MRFAAAMGLLAAVTTAVVAVVLVAFGYGRCIDSPQFLNPWPVVVTACGLGLSIAGTIGVRASEHTRLGAMLLVSGILLVAVALAGPPYNSCREWGGLIPH